MSNEYKRTLTTFICFLLLSFTLCSSLCASSGFGREGVGSSGAQFLRLGVNARAIGMGEAYSAVCDGSDAVYWNPAALARIDGKSILLMHTDYLQSAFYDFASYAQKIGTLGTFGLGFQYFTPNAIDETNEFGTVGSFKPYDSAVTLGWARKMKFVGSKGDVLVGASGKFIRSKIIETAMSGAGDFGIVWNQWKSLWLAAGVQNIGDGIKFKNESDDLPLNVKVGSAYQFFKSLIVALDANFPRDNDPNVSIGTEYQFPVGNEIGLLGRAGYQSRTAADIQGVSSVSAGLGVKWKCYGLDFAWVPFGKLGNSYRVSVAGKF